MIVSIFGQMNNGKSTFARMLLEHLNNSIRMNMVELRMTNVFQLGSFAKKLKDIISIKYGIALGDVDYWKNDPRTYPGWNCTMRECLQREGEFSRQIDPNVWIRPVVNNHYPLVVDDGRHENEAKAVSNAKGYNILLVRPDYINDSEHVSESWVGSLIKSMANRKEANPLFDPALSLFHHVVMNTGDLEKLDVIARMVSQDILKHYKECHVNMG